MGFITIGWLAFLLVLGVAVAPVAAVLCAVAALSRKSSWSGVAYFAGAGALHGVSITGWIYVLARIFNRSLPFPVIVVVYFLPYVSWICFVVGAIGLYLYWVWGSTLGVGGMSVLPGADVGSAVGMSMLLGGIAAVCLFAWGMSLRDLAHRYKRDRARRTEAPSVDFGYIKPFLYNYVWLVIGICTAFVFAMYGNNIGGCLPDGCVGF